MTTPSSCGNQRTNNIQSSNTLSNCSKRRPSTSLNCASGNGSHQKAAEKTLHCKLTMANSYDWLAAAVIRVTGPLRQQCLTPPGQHRKVRYMGHVWLTNDCPGPYRCLTMLLLMLCICGHVVFAAPHVQLYDHWHELINMLVDKVIMAVPE